jgi:hypothetical protein
MLMLPRSVERLDAIKGSVRFQYEGSGARSQQAILVVRREEKDDVLPVLCGPYHDGDASAHGVRLPYFPLPSLPTDLQ